MAEPDLQAKTQTSWLEYLALAATDHAQGVQRGLAEYIALFPRHEREIARAWLHLDEEHPAEPHPPATADKRVGPFLLLDELGRGGQAIVWLAKDTVVDRLVALKTVALSPVFGQLTPRLEREAQALAKIDHPGIGEIYGLGRDDGVGWISMRLEPGETLAAKICVRDTSGDSKVGDCKQLIGWVESAARALHAAHSAGILHRDVKPSNLMIRDDGQVVLLDFGVAVSDSSPVPLTLTGESVGTPGYMAPEQLADGRGPVDRRTDVWALGVTLYEALSGHRPFQAPTRQGEARRVLNEEPDPLEPARTTGVRSRDLHTLMMTALAKDPALRYATAESFAEDLKQLRTGQPVMARRPGRLTLFVRWAGRRPALASALGGLILVAILAIGLFVRSERQLRAFRRLADLEIARNLIEARRSLFPIHSGSAPDLDLWLARAEELFEREGLHQAMVEGLPEVGPRLWAKGDESGQGWMRAQLQELLALLEDLRGHHAFIQPQAQLAHDMERLAFEEHAELWAAAIDRVAGDPRFDGFTLVPQPGLLPLGPDPQSQLEEFSHLPTGQPVWREVGSGRITLAEDSGVVLILIPTGDTVIGASRPGEGLPHPEPNIGLWDGPPQSLRLDPFLISKFELTQAQWQARTGTNPSRHRTGEEGSRYVQGSSALNPVENVSLQEVTGPLAEMGLAVPTEAQWEHCARAATHTPWSFGDEPELIEDHGNVADQSVHAISNEVGWTLTAGVNDGHIAHARVGSFAANPWGLHDVHGNVDELTRSTYEDWNENPPQDGEGVTVAKYNLIVHRGGRYNLPVLNARSSHRNGIPPDAKGPSIGVRPIARYRP